MNINLESFHTQNGEKALINYAHEHKDTIISMINQQNISFRTFFPLISFISKENLSDGLMYKYRIAILVVNCDINEDLERLCQAENSEIHKIFLWIFASHSKIEKNHVFSKAIDFIVASLICDFKDCKILPDVCRHIFKRNQENEYIHDIVWAFFKSRDKNLLKYIAYYLNSVNKKDTSLAHELLSSFCDDEIKPNSSYEWYNWISENSQYMYHTNKNYQLCSNPQTLKVDYHSKFIGKSTTNYIKHSNLTEIDIKSMACFSCEKDLNAVSKFAHNVRKSKINQKWNSLSTEEKVAKALKEVL